MAQLPGLELADSMQVLLDGAALVPEAIPSGHGGRIHRLQAAPGTLTINYNARIDAQSELLVAQDYDRSRYLRPSRYAECDKFFGFVAGQFD